MIAPVHFASSHLSEPFFITVLANIAVPHRSRYRKANCALLYVLGIYSYYRIAAPFPFHSHCKVDCNKTKHRVHSMRCAHLTKACHGIIKGDEYLRECECKNPQTPNSIWPLSNKGRHAARDFLNTQGRLVHTRGIRQDPLDFLREPLTYFIATPPDRGWQRNEGLLLLHSFLSFDILVAFSILRFDTSAKSVS